MEVPLSRPDISPKERELVQQVMATDYLSMGPMLPRFEGAMAKFIGSSYAVGVSSGTAGLHLAMKCLGIGPGDEVITTPFSFVASANCILYEGATPVFVDVDPYTLNIAPELIEEAINPRTRGILPVHIFGQPCDMGPIMEIAKRHSLMVVEDACEAIGAEYLGRKVGTFGRASVFAFYPNKQMTTGEGGIIVIDDPEWAELCGSLRNQGRETGDQWLRHVRLGYNYRLDELSAALGVAQLERIQELLDKRGRVAAMYDERLQGIEGLEIPYVSPKTTRMSWFVYVVRLHSSLDRHKVARDLAAAGIPTRPYFTPIHLQPFYVERYGYKPGDFHHAEAAGSSTLALPFHANLSGEEIDYVCENLRNVVASAMFFGGH